MKTNESVRVQAVFKLCHRLGPNCQVTRIPSRQTLTTFCSDKSSNEQHFSGEGKWRTRRTGFAFLAGLFDGLRAIPCQMESILVLLQWASLKLRRKRGRRNQTLGFQSRIWQIVILRCPFELINPFPVLLQNRWHMRQRITSEHSGFAFWPTVKSEDFESAVCIWKTFTAQMGS